MPSSSTAKWPRPSDVDRLTILRKYEQIFNGNLYSKDEKSAVFQLKQFFQRSRSKREVLAIAINLGSLISTIFADYGFGEGFKVRTQESTKEDELNEIKDRNQMETQLYESSIAHSYAGYTTYHVRKVDGKAVIEEVPYNNSFPDYSGVVVGGKPSRWVLATFFTRTDDKGRKKHYVLKVIYSFSSEFTIEDKPEVVINNEVWRIEETTLHQTKQVELQAFFPDMPEFEKTGLTEIPIEQIDNIKTVKDRFGKSDYKKILGLLEELNDRFTQISLQFVKHLNAKISAPSSSLSLDNDGNVKAQDLEVFKLEPGEQAPTYIEYSNNLIEEAFKHIELTIKLIANISQVSQTALLGDEKAGVEKVEALRIRLMNFEKKIMRNRKSFENGLKKIFRIAMAYEGKEIDLKDISIRFEESIPRDRLAEAMALSTALTGGFISKERAVIEYQGLEDEDLEAELEKIRVQEQIPTFDI